MHIQRQSEAFAYRIASDDPYAPPAGQDRFADTPYWFHASPYELAPGTMLVPRGGKTTWNRFYNQLDPHEAREIQNYVWLDNNINVSRNRAYGRGHYIYRVEPTDEPQERGLAGGGHSTSSARIQELIEQTPKRKRKTKHANTIRCAAVWRLGSVTVPVGDDIGLHARPASIISDAVMKAGVPVHFSMEGSDPVDASSPLEIMMMGAGYGTPVTVHCDDPSIAEAIAKLVGQNFNKVGKRLGRNTIRCAMPYYHNTDAELEPGDEIIPAAERGYESQWKKNKDYNPHMVYFTYGDDDTWAEDWRGRNRYEVEPIGEVKQDPEHLTQRKEFEEEYGRPFDPVEDEDEDIMQNSYTSPRARVIRRLPLSDYWVWQDEQDKRPKRKVDPNDPAYGPIPIPFEGRKYLSHNTIRCASDTIRVYHGTSEDNAATIVNTQSWLPGNGGWFTPDRSRAESYGPAIISLDLPRHRVPRRELEFYLPHNTRLLRTGPFTREARKSLSSNTIRCASDDDLILYHGTGADSVPHIQQNGLMHPPSVSPAGWPMLTTSFDQAKAYATRDNPVVLEYHVPANLTYSLWRTHRTGEEPYLWDAQDHSAYDYPAQSYALKRPLPASFLHAVHSV